MQRHLPDAEKRSGPQAEEEARQLAAPLLLGSSLGSPVLSLNARYSFTEKLSLEVFWLYTSW